MQRLWWKRTRKSGTMWPAAGQERNKFEHQQYYH
jgi:hypothetical protein